MTSSTAESGGVRPWLPAALPDDPGRLEDLEKVDPRVLQGREIFFRITEFVSDVFGIENAGISVVAEDEEYFLANTVTPNQSGSREQAFCAHTILADEPFVLEDATADPVFAEHPQVLAAGVKFYAGAPIFGPGGRRIGALCVRDTEAHSFGPEQRRLLKELGIIASHTMATELDNVRLETKTKELETALVDIARLQDEIVEARRLEAIGSLAAGVAHEINTPTQFIGDNLHFIRDNVGMLLEAVATFTKAIGDDADSASPANAIDEFAESLDVLDFEFIRADVPEAVDQSVQGVNQIAQIVRSLRDLSHPGTEDPEPADLNQIVENSVVVSRGRWKDHSDLTMELEANLSPVSCRSSQIGQAVLNLITNAADAAAGPTRGTITVKTAQVASYAEIAVTDSGPGVPDDIRDRIFDPFFTTKAVGNGTGQGLPISRKVIEDHGGTLTLDSSPTTGATFRIRLPLTSI